MSSHHPKTLSRYFVSLAISCVLVFLLCAPLTFPVAASPEDNTGANSNVIVNVPAAQTQGIQRSDALIDVMALAGLAFGNNLEAKRYSVLMKYADTLKASANKLFQYGLDTDNVPFAQKADGTKARYVNLSSDHFRLQIVKGSGLGEVEFTSLTGDKTLTRFKTVGGDSLFVRTTKIQTGNNGATRINVGFQYKNEIVALNLDEESAEKGLALYGEKELRVILAHVGKNSALKELLEDTRIFTDTSVLSGAMSATVILRCRGLSSMRISCQRLRSGYRGIHLCNWRFAWGLRRNARGRLYRSHASAPSAFNLSNSTVRRRASEMWYYST